MSAVNIETGRPYQVRIERGLLSRVGDETRAVLPKAKTAALLTDDAVNALYGDKVERSLAQSGFSVCRFAFPHGERSKTLGCFGDMLSFLAENRLTRTDCAVALGGGVTGDLAGFAAASYLRGIPFVQVPTTLLAMVDSSVGGKTGANLPAGKNLVGAFYQPSRVLCDPDALATLPPDILADGVAESVKHGVLQDEALFALFESGDWQKNQERAIEQNVRIKAAHVAADERDTGLRQRLNLGHTLGHAIEKRSGFTVSHGHAVAVGMVYAARLSLRLGLCRQETLDRIIATLKRQQLPTAAPYAAESLLDTVLSDKKRAGDTLTFVLPRKIGECALYPMDVSELPRAIHLAVEE